MSSASNTAKGYFPFVYVQTGKNKLCKGGCKGAKS